MECPNCHQAIPDDAKYCGYCGTPQAKPEPATAQLARPEPRPQPQAMAPSPVILNAEPQAATEGNVKQTRAWLWWVLAALLAGVLMIVCAGIALSWYFLR